MIIDGPGKVELVYTDSNGNEREVLYTNLKLPVLHREFTILMLLLKALQEPALNMLLVKKRIFGLLQKDTISKQYDHTFKDIFEEIYEKEYKQKFEEANITYFYTLIDDAVPEL